MRSVLSLMLVLAMCLPTGATLCTDPETVPETVAQDPAAAAPAGDTAPAGDMVVASAGDTTAAPGTNTISTVAETPSNENTTDTPPENNTVTTAPETPAGAAPEGNAEVGDTAVPPAAPETEVIPDPETPKAPDDGTAPETPVPPSDGTTPDTPEAPGDGTTVTPGTEDIPDSETPKTDTPETPAEPEKQCTCTPNPDGTHAEGCPLYQAPVCTCVPNADGTLTYTKGCPVHPAPAPTTPEMENVPMTAVSGDTQVTVTGLFPKGSYVVLSQVNELPELAQVMMLSMAAEPPAYVAYDVTVYDASGTKVEPEGEATVKFRFGPEAPVDAAAVESLSVVHFKEDDQGTIVDAETPTPTSTVSDDETVVETTFTTTSFSTFVITWTKDGKTYFEVKLWYVDQNGTEFEVSQFPNETDSISKGDIIKFADYAVNLEGFKYQEARLENKDGKIVTSMEAQRKDKKYNINFYKGDTSVSRYCEEDKTKTINVYLVHEVNTSPDVPDVAPPTVEHNKKAERNDDGTYTLTLDVKGAVSTVSDPKKLDVLLILDQSESMLFKMRATGEDWAEAGSRRIDITKAALEKLTGKLNSNEGLDVRYNMVGFCWTSRNLMDWTDSPNENIDDIITDMTQDMESHRSDKKTYTGTNYQAGINAGIEALKTSRSDAEKIVIFLTDGEPNWPKNVVPMNVAEAAIKGLNCNQFYAIGVGSDFGDSNSQPVRNLTRLIGSVGGNNPPEAKELYTATDTTALETAFSGIAGSVYTFCCSNVTITDTLSQNVEIVTSSVDADGNPTPSGADLTITVKDGNGNTIQTGPSSVTLNETTSNEQATITATVENGAIKLNFPSSYQLEKDWTYSVMATIKPSEKAYENYRTSGYTATGDLGTGTHAGEKGLNSNDSAAVTYTFQGKSNTVYYPMPVIQVPSNRLEDDPGKVILRGEKLWDDAGNETKRPASITVCLYASDVKIGEVQTDASKDWKYEFDISDQPISNSITYRVEEVAVPDYTEDVSKHKDPEVTFTPPSAGTWTVVSSCDDLVIPITDTPTDKTIVIVKSGNRNIVWTVDPLSEGERDVIEAEMANINGLAGNKGIYYFSGEGSLATSSVPELADVDMTVADGEVTFGKKSDWSLLCHGTYSRGSADAREASITNVYAQGDLKITKDFSGLTAAEIEKILPNLTFTVTGGETSVTVDNTTRKKVDDTTYTWTVENLKAGNTYKITESGADLVGYTTTTDYAPADTATVENGQTAEVTVTNTYTKNVLTIEKVLKSFNKDMGDDATFLFKVEGNGQVYYRMVNFKKTDFSILGGVSKSVTIEGIPAGTYTVTELAVTGYEATDGYTREVTIASTGEVTFTNQAKSGSHGDTASAKNTLTYQGGTWVITPAGKSQHS